MEERFLPAGRTRPGSLAALLSPDFCLEKEARQLSYKLKAKRFQRLALAAVYSLLIVLRSHHGPA